MRLLVVALSNSIHTARWLRQLTGQGWEIHLFPSLDFGLTHPELRELTVHHWCYSQRGKRGSMVKTAGFPVGSEIAQGLLMRLRRFLVPDYQRQRLVRLIAELKPDIVHSLEFQAAGYLTLAAKEEIGSDFPPWIATNWGSDIYHFARFPEHEVRIRRLLAACDYYSCECRRDVCLAEGYGLRGEVLPVMPNAGGFDLADLALLRQPGAVAARRLIMVKGWHYWAGRALVALDALDRCADLLRDYEIVVHSPSPETRAAAKRLIRKRKLRLRLLPHSTPHREIMALYGRARIALGLSMSDGISTSFLEALTMGSFPVQSWTACADEWVEDGVGGLLVPPEDSSAVATALRRALTDDVLVESAAQRNFAVASEQLDNAVLKSRARGYYQRVMERGKTV